MKGEAMEQATLFDIAREGRADGLKRVDEHAEPEWKDVAYDAVVATARCMPEFISDDVWAIGELDSTREDRALGPVFLRAARDRVCVKTDRVRPSVRSHLSGKPVWRSLIFDDRSPGQNPPAHNQEVRHGISH